MPLNENAINEILPFATDGSVIEGDLMSLDEYIASNLRRKGHQTGVALRSVFNRQARQTSHIAAGVAQFIANQYPDGVVDDGDIDKVEAGLTAAIKKITNDGMISVPIADTTKAGIVQPDGTSITVDVSGKIAATPPSTSRADKAASYKSDGTSTTTGFAIADGTDLATLFGKLDTAANATSGTGTFVSSVALSVSGKKVTLTQTKGTPGYCSYCSYCGYCSYCSYCAYGNNN